MLHQGTAGTLMKITELGLDLITDPVSVGCTCKHTGGVNGLGKADLSSLNLLQINAFKFLFAFVRRSFGIIISTLEICKQHKC